MIHGKTAQMQQRRTRRVVAVIVAVVLAVLLWFAWDMTSAQTEAQSAASVRTAVLDLSLIHISSTAATKRAAFERGREPSLRA